MDPKLILETAENREDISAIEALLLLQEGRTVHDELLSVADSINQRLHARNVTFVRSKQVNYSNICKAECKFCSFGRKKAQKDAYVLKPSDVVRQVRDAGVRQVTLQGGLNPDLGLPWHLDMLRTVKSELPHVHIHGYSPSEIYFVARRSRTSPMDVLKRFREAGLDSLSGDSADILNDKVRKKICSDKLRTNDWVEIIKASHRLGMTTTATMLFGHVEDEIQLSEHLDIIKHIQKETGGITAFEPIPFVPAGSALARDKRYRHQIPLDQILRIIAVARIFLAKSIRNITVDWTKVGLPAALRCVSAGVNDIGPVAIDSVEIRSSEVNGRLSVPVPVLRSGIQKIGRVPVDREPYTTKSLPAKIRREELALV
jgi:CofH subfamily radical SAM domain protein